MIVRPRYAIVTATVVGVPLKGEDEGVDVTLFPPPGLAGNPSQSVPDPELNRESFGDRWDVF
jgi:hypothetical protein